MKIRYAALQLTEINLIWITKTSKTEIKNDFQTKTEIKK